MINLYWLNPIIFLLSLFGYNIFMTVDGDGGGSTTPDPAEEEEDDFVEVTDDTDIMQLSEDELDQVLDSDEVDADKYLEFIKGFVANPDTERKILMKDIRRSPQKEGDDVDKDNPPDFVEPKDASQAVPGKVETPPAKPESETGKDNPPPAQQPGVDKAQPKSKAPFQVNDEYITKAVADFKERNKDKQPEQLTGMVKDYEQILNGIKGETFTQKAFNNYMNSQIYIKTVKSPFDANWKPDPKTVNDPKYVEQATEKKNAIMLNSIVSEYPGFPRDGLTNQDARDEFESSLKPRELNKYFGAIDRIEKQVNERFDRWYYYTQNWESICADTVKTDVELFENWLGQRGLKKADLGIPDLSLDDKFHNKFLFDNILFLKDKQPNSEIITMMGDYPVIKPMSVFNALKDLYIDDVIEMKENEAVSRGVKIGQDNTIEPSISESQNPGQRQIEGDNPTKVIDNEDAPLEEIDKALDKIKKGVVNFSRKKR